MSALSFQYCSDLHLEFNENASFIRKNPIIPQSEILILAGDIVPFAYLKEVDWFFDQLEKDFKYIYWIAGNHEYYGSNIALRSGRFLEKIRPRLFLVNNCSFLHEDTAFLFTTLWSKIALNNLFDIQNGMSDYRLITYNGRLFNVGDSNRLFEENLTFLTKDLAQYRDKQTVVVTHHVPTYKNYPEKYKFSLLNEAFATELEGFIRENSIDYWVYGHSHANVAPFKIGQTTLINNQLGYVQSGEHHRYIDSAIINL